MNDMMKSFDLFQPHKVEDALGLLNKYGKEGWKLAGGNDSFDWFKDRIKKPKVVVDLSAISELKGIKKTSDGIEIGAMTTLTEIETNKMIRQNFGVLADAARKVASPQIRNVGTIGGNVAQDTRCWYYRDGFSCYRAGGTTCYADTPTGMNREHCLFGADRCIAVSPTDTGPALMVLDAQMVIRSSSGEKVVAASDFFIGPKTDILRMTVLKEGDILTAIRIPDKWAGARFYFEKVADRNSWDFALVNVASAMKITNGVIKDANIACGGVECVPRKMPVISDIIKGEKQSDEIAEIAGQAATRGAVPLNYNHFKIVLLENLVKRAIRES